MKKNNFSANLGVLALFIVALGVATACKSQPPGSSDSAPGGAVPAEIVIGEVWSLTGSEATFGISSKNAVAMIIDATNAAGGIHGQKIRRVILDNQGKPEESATAITRLISQDKVVAVLGEVASSRSIAMAPIAQANKVPMISPSSTNPKVTEMGDYIFRTCYIDPFQGSLMAKFGYENLKLKKAAIFTDIRNDYSVGLSKFFKEKWLALGGEVISEQSYSAGDIDFKAQLTAIRGANPELIYLPAYYTDAGLIMRQAKELQITAPFTGGDGWDSAKLFEIGGAALNGNYFSNHYSAENKDPAVQKFVAEYKAKYGEVPDALAGLGYDAAGLLVDAMKRAKSLSGPDLRLAINETKDFPGIAGKINFDANRNPVKPAVIIKIEDQQQRYFATMQP